MKGCELCGAENEDNAETCSRCGFEFPKAIRSDIRDKAILEKHQGKSLDQVKVELKEKQAQMRSYLENVEAKEIEKGEMVALLDGALEFLKVPYILGVEDELAFSQDEAGFIELMLSIIEKADAEHGGPIATSGTYIRMANALHAMDDSDNAMKMIEKALLINPQDKDGQYARAKLLFYAKDYKAAKRCLEKLMEKGEHPKAGYLAELIEQISNQ